MKKHKISNKRISLATIDKINAELDFGQDKELAEALAPRLAEDRKSVV